MTRQKGKIWNFADRLEGDKVVWIIALMLILISIVCIFSSTSRLLEGSQTRLDIVRSQILVVSLGLVLIIICYNIKNIKFYRVLSKWGFPVTFILLTLLISKINTGVVKSIEINGARRILQFGSLQIHVFEVVKVAMVMYLSWAVDALRKKEIKFLNVSEEWKKVILVYAPFLITLLMLVPGSISAALFIGAIMFIVILLGGGDNKTLFKLGFAAVLLMGACWGIYKVSDGHAMKRIGTGIERVTNHTDYEKIYLTTTNRLEKQKALDAMRQPIGAKIAVKEGGILGKGPGQSTQRYMVPDVSEDYMFSFIIEEYGLWGALLVIALYVSLVARGAIIVRNCGSDTYAKLVVAGLCLLISGQAFLHMFVNADIGPMTGQTLPLISHGNSAFLCFSLAFGIILSFSRIASRRIEKETRESAPLVEFHENVKSGLDELDAFESGENTEDEFNDYGI